MCNSAKSGGQMKSSQANNNALKAAEAVVPRLMKHLSLQLRKHLQSEQAGIHLIKQTSATGFGPSTQMLGNTKRNCHTVSADSLSDTYPPNILQCRYRLLARVSSFHAEEDDLLIRALPPIPWIRGLKILLGAAEGIAYLHKGLEIQSSNVLLDPNFNAKLSDLRLAREGPQGD
nr:probable serine/threonine-protein kinase PBL19 [Tanacetum cinerariifolium]